MLRWVRPGAWRFFMASRGHEQGARRSALPRPSPSTVITSLSSYTLPYQVENLVYTGSANATFIGSSSPNTITSGIGDDVLSGGYGNDTLIGKEGFDTLTGGAGGDHYVFLALADSTVANPDLITDFSAGTAAEKIDLSAIDAIAGGGDDAFTFIGTAAFSGTAGELRYSVGATERLVEVDVDGDASADLAIRLTGTGALASSNFIL